MFFEREKLTCHLLDVLELKQKNIHMTNSGRNFDALSFRLHADTVLRTVREEYCMGDYAVSYVPAGLDYSRVSRVDELIVVHFTSDYRSGRIETFLPQRPDRFEDLFREILGCRNRREAGYQHRCTSLLYAILEECYRENCKDRNVDSKIQSAVSYLLENFKNPELSIPDLAKKSFVSEVYFRKLFKAEYGISPKRYLIELRIQNAVGLIDTGYYSLQEVAEMSGYSDYKYFSTEFKRIVGVSPSEYSYRYLG